MITQVTLRNFKSIEEQTYDFTPFDLIVGRNNSGKSTILQALAIWQFCIDEFRRAKRRGKTGKQVVLPNFTALPVPEFNLLWRDKTDRKYSSFNGTKKQEFILIEIQVTWLTNSPELTQQSFGVKLRYGSPQTLYAIPVEGWEHFRTLEGEQEGQDSQFPIIAYVPPFSGLEPSEEWRDEGPLRKQIGKAQPGSVLRNLLFRVWEKDSQDWLEIQRMMQRWFGIDLQEPRYERGVDTQIICEYQQGSKSYDIIAGGSGFHQALTLLAFFYGYQPTTILLDEPDAHLHVNLQREILEYFRNQRPPHKITQFLIATHAEAFVQGVDARQIVSLLDKTPKRIRSTPAILTAMAEVSNLEVTQLSVFPTPILLYVEGETDERLLRSWAAVLGIEDCVRQVYFRIMWGGSKEKMSEDSQQHFNGIKQIIPNARRLILFDYDEEKSFHPEPNNPVLLEWRRKNIENYLLVPDAWIRAAHRKIGIEQEDLTRRVTALVEDFFLGQNLTLPPNQSWRTVKANIFQVVNGKKILFENSDSLFQGLKALALPMAVPSGLELSREMVAAAMTAAEIHEDVHQFFRRLQDLIQP